MRETSQLQHISTTQPNTPRPMSGKEEEDRYDQEEFDDDVYEDDEQQMASSVEESKQSSDSTKTKPRRRRKKKKMKKKKKKKVPAARDEEYYEDEMDGVHDSQDYPQYMDDEDGYGYDDEPMDSYAATRRESARIMSKRFLERNQVKAKIMREREKVHRRLQNSKKKKENQWRRKMERSPFMVDLIAENERIDEENKVRIEEETRRERMLSQRKEKIKNEIVLKALSEVSDLDALRREKRLIADEEKRLKALLIMEKANAHTKADLMAAQRAERQRKQVQAQYRRARLREETQRRRELEVELLREKLAAPPQQAFSSNSRIYRFLGKGQDPRSPKDAAVM